MNKTIGVLSIGQSPRPELLVPFHQLINGYEIQERGALDNLSLRDLPEVTQSRYPLTTRMRDGTLITVDESFLAPLLQQAISSLEEDGVVALILLCAGPFADLQSKSPLFNPFKMMRAVLRSMRVRHIGVVCPTDDQHEAARQKWSNAGFEPALCTIEPDMDPEAMGKKLVINAQQMSRVQCIVLDYVGYTTQQVASAQSAVSVPILDLGLLSMATMASVLT